VVIETRTFPAEFPPSATPYILPHSRFSAPVDLWEQSARQGLCLSESGRGVACDTLSVLLGMLPRILTSPRYRAEGGDDCPGEYSQTTLNSRLIWRFVPSVLEDEVLLPDDRSNVRSLPLSILLRRIETDFVLANRPPFRLANHEQLIREGWLDDSERLVWPRSTRLGILDGPHANT
jgi:hypothetical protein